MTESPMDDRDVDAAFAEIVAGWEDWPPEPAEEAATGPGEPAVPDPGVSAPPQEAPPPPPGWREHTSLVDVPEEDFEPEPVQLPAQTDLGYWGAVGGVGGGTVLLFVTALLRPYPTGLWFALALLLLGVGATLVVLRLPSDHDDDDSGARV